MKRPEIAIKFQIAEMMGQAKHFPNGNGMWSLTAAQRSLMLGRPDDKADPKHKKPVRLYTMEQLQSLSDAANARQDEIKAKVQRIGDEDAPPPIRLDEGD